MIRPAKCAEILNDPNIDFIISEYAKECRILELGDVNLQIEQYLLMEKSGSLQAFGVYDGENLVGFATVLVSILPHYGKIVAISDFIFVLKSHRNTKENLFDYLENYACESGCFSFIYSAPVGSRFDQMMSLRKKRYIPTHNEYMVVLHRGDSRGD